MPTHKRTIFAAFLLIMAITLFITTNRDPIAFCAMIFAAGLFTRAAQQQWKSLRLHRRVWRLSKGKCPSCGYDTRASSTRCPECGSKLYTHPTIHPTKP